MFCENCGAENPDDARFCTGCGHEFKNVAVNASEEKNMFFALAISFFLAGLGIAYAGNVKKGALLFAACLIFYILGIGIAVCAVIGVLIWAYGLYETYNQVEIANGRKNPNLIEDWKGWSGSKKIGAAIVVMIIVLCVLGGAINAFTPDDDYSSADSDYSTSSSSSNHKTTGSASSSGGSSSYSSSKNGHDVSSHYEGEYGSSDTHGTVYDDGSVESHQTGHTDYGDYRVDSYMDSNGNIHGTVDVGGKTYHVSS